MSPFTPANSPRISPQWNPFGEIAFGSPWHEVRIDVRTIHEAAFTTIMAELNQVKWGNKGSIVITGEPGSGKTHLLGRVRKNLPRDTAYIYVRCNASATTLWRHVRASVATDLLKQEAAVPSQLQRVLKEQPHRVQTLESRTLQLVLRAYAEGRNVNLASAWLRGETLGSSDLDALGIGTHRDNEEDRSWEYEARVIVDGLLKLLAPEPVVLCFDQLEALETYRGDEEGFHAMGTLVSQLIDNHNHLLLVSCVISAFEDKLDRLPNGADRDRWLQQKITLRPIEWQEGLKLVKERLASAPGLIPFRSQHPENPLYPLNPDDLKPLFEKTGLCLPRNLIQRCKILFQGLFKEGVPDPVSAPSVSREDFLQEVFTKNVNEARATVTRLGGDKTLSESLPWLMQNSGFTPLGQDAQRSQYAGMAFRHPAGNLAVSLCYGSGNPLTGRLKKIDKFWKPQQIDLCILRDASVTPGAVGLDLLNRLKEKGAREIHPLPEALAALQAIHNMIASARSGDLRQDGQMVSEPEVTQWSLSNLPAQLEQLRDELTRTSNSAPASKPEPADPTLPKLAAILRDHKVIEAGVAASELSLSLEEVSACASRHPMRFGVLAGPPLVLFQAVEGPSTEPFNA